MKTIFVCILSLAAAVFSVGSAAAQTDSVKNVVIKVGNIHCGNDMPTIKKQLLNQDGIDEVTFTEIAHSSSVFTITYHSSVTNKERIEKAIESTPGCDDKNETPYKVKREGTRKKGKS